jgi:group I intron endonuclease
MELYRITNKIEGTCYIGKTSRTVRKRWQEHLWVAKSGHRTSHLYNAIRKYGAEAFEIQVICHPTTEESLNEWELFLISFYRNQLGEQLYNQTDGGEGMQGLLRTVEHNRKIGDALRGRRFPERIGHCKGCTAGPQPTHCKYGHPRTPENVDARRTCKTCKSLWSLKHPRRDTRRGSKR